MDYPATWTARRWARKIKRCHKYGPKQRPLAPVEALARADLATIAVVCAFSPDASNTTVEIGADAKADMQPLDGKQLFSSLRKDVVPEHYSSQYWSYLQ